MYIRFFESCDSFIEPGRRWHIHAHQAQCFRLVQQSRAYMVIRLADQTAQRAAEKVLLSVGAPRLRYRGCRSAHCSLNLFLFDLLGHVWSEDHLAWFIHKADRAEAKLQKQIVVQLYHVVTSQKDCLQRALNDVLAHLASISDRDRVCIDHTEALLVNRPLGFGVNYLLFAMISNR